MDQLLAQLGLAESREQAQRLIRAGLVVGPDKRFDKPGHLIDADTALRVLGAEHPYVSRGGVKLAGALDAFALDPAGAVALDLGASTGGFTDCLLQRGAAKVYAIDVGRGQLHARLAADPRVDARERTHLDALEPEQFDPRPALAVADLSFISATRALGPLERVLARPAAAALLVKPQFELGRGRIPRGGVVTDPAAHREAVDMVKQSAAARGWEVAAEAPSPIAGGDGNREFFLLLRLA
ncbi:MAG: TlyA family RNA methyltransferase [Candidatus Sumerlaeia bacterium]|nr:TlyA family RNA methyltransferase [Candidatus Sumerlaeia bacterium]